MDKNSLESAPVGIFDSGVGGLSVLREIYHLLPAENLIYFGDQAHVPYGPRPLEEVRKFTFEAAQFFVDQGVKVLVIACNTASAAALKELRVARPDLPIVGMEPAVKPAAEQTRTGRVGVLATPATFQGALYASVVERFAQEVTLFQSTCPGLVAQIEKGELDAPETRRILEEAIHPMLAQQIDTIVLGCTHYPFVIPLIQQVAGPGVRVIDPAPAVARQTWRVLQQQGLLRPSAPSARILFFTSGEMEQMARLIPRLTSLKGEIQKLDWREGRLVVQESAGRMPIA